MKAERRNVVPLFVSLPACFCLHATHILYPARPASVHTDTPHQPHSAPITHVSHINIKHTAQSVQHPVFRPPRHHPIFLHIYAKRPSSLHIHSSSTSREPRICSSRHSRPQIREFYAPLHNMLQVNQLYNHDSQCSVPVMRNWLSRITIKPLRCCQKASLTRWKGQCRTATAALPHIHNSMHTLYSASKKAVWVILHHPARLHVMISYHNRKPLAFLFQTFLLSKFFTAEHA